MSDTQSAPRSPITTTVDAPHSWQRVVSIEVARDLFEKEYAQRLKKAARSHQKPGFRKGRTPKAMVERELGDRLRMEATEELIKQAWMVGLLENKLNPLTDPALEDFKFEDEGPMTFKLKVEVRPQVDAVEYEDIPVKQREVEVQDQDVTDVLERLRESRAVFEKVDRAAEKDDQILMDLVPAAWDGEPDGAKRIDDQRLILGAEGNLDAFNEALAGVSAGQEKEISVTYPADHPNEKLKGQTVVFQCIVKEVSAKVLPELDDQLAAQIQEGKTLPELTEGIRQDLVAEAERRVAQEMDQQIQNAVVERNEVDLPPSMVASYLDSGLEEMHRRNLQTGRQNSDEEDAQYREVGQPHAEKALRAMLLFESIREKEGIKVTDEDVEEKIQQIADENSFDVDQYREFVNSGDEKNRLQYDLLERRTYDFLLSRAAVETVPADTDVLAEKEK